MIALESRAASSPRPFGGMIKNIPAGASLFDVGGDRRQRVRRRPAASRFRPSSTFCSNASSTLQAAAAPSACGLTEHIREIRSFNKLTGEGVTLVGSDMVRILEEVLPARFGGSPLDYQLLEEEDDLGRTRLHLVVSPAIRIDDEAMVVETVLGALRKCTVAGDLAAAIWSQAGTLRVRRAAPVWTARGKFMPFRRIDDLKMFTWRGER